ncbi:MAG: AzlD domain-containing protein [Pseudomonadota bacterium]
MSETSFLITLAILTAAALSTRIVGALLMNAVKPSPQVERFLEGISASVIAALVASQMIGADTERFAAVGVAVLIVLATRNVVLAMAGGMLLAAFF